MAPSFLVLWRCPACRHFWQDQRPFVCNSDRPECGLSNVDAVTWCSNEDDDCLLTLEEMEDVIACQLRVIMAMR
jgi:hypothetical protein